MKAMKLKILSLVLLLANGLTAGVLPTADEVRSVSIKITYGRETSGIQFQATAEDWEKIRSTLLPAELVDPKKPKKLWEGLADVKISKKDGQSLDVLLWRPATDPGAFSVGGKTYRGGENSKIMKAILDALEESKRRPNENK
jgi:hypothetical protein